MPNTAYRVPGVTGTASTQQLSGSGRGQRLMSLVGVGGSGPDMPTYYNNLAAALSAYGSPASAAPGTLPWGLQAAMGALPSGGTAAPIVVSRVGVIRASVILLDQTPITPKTWATVQPIGAYAGSAGNTVQCLVSVGTVTGTTKVIVQTTGGTVLSTYDNLISGNDFSLKASGDLNIAVSGSATGAVNLAAVGTFTCTSGADGLGSTPGGGVWAAAISALFNGSVTAPRYVCALYDGASVYADVASALASATGSGVLVPMPAIAFLGSGGVNTVAANQTTAGSVANSSIWYLGNPSFNRFDPILNGYRSFDGFYAAATAMAMKAALPVEQSLINMTLPGWTSVGQVNAGGMMRSAVLSDVSSLGSYGAAYAMSGNGFNGVQLVDSLTTAAQTGVNGYLSQVAMVDCLYEAQSVCYNTAQAWIGQPYPVNTDPTNGLAGALTAALSQLVGGALADVGGVTVTADTTSIGRLIPTVSVKLRQTTRYIDFTFNVSY